MFFNYLSMEWFSSFYFKSSATVLAKYFAVLLDPAVIPYCAKNIFYDIDCWKTTSKCLQKTESLAVILGITLTKLRGDFHHHHLHLFYCVGCSCLFVGNILACRLVCIEFVFLHPPWTQTLEAPVWPPLFQKQRRQQYKVVATSAKSRAK